MSDKEIATQDEFHTELSVLPPQPSQQTQTAIARQVLRDHAELSQMAWEFATKLVGTKMVPVRFRNAPEEATAAILYGAELGLGPISALQNIFEVHGSPGIYARTAQALLEAKGFQFRTIESTNDVATVHGWRPGANPRTDEPDEWSTFTYEDAERAGWAPQPLDADKGGILIRGVRYEANQYGKLAGNEKYLTQPRQMLWAKAMMETCRHISPATLLGIAYSVEELESERSAANDPGTGPSRPVAAAEAPLTVDEILSAAPEQRTGFVPIKGGDLPPSDGPIGGTYQVGDEVFDHSGSPVESKAAEPEPKSAEPQRPAKSTGKRAAAKEQREAEAKQKADLKAATKKLPKDAAERVATALAHARAAQEGGGLKDTETPETTPAAEPEPQASPDSSDPVTSAPEPSDDELDHGYDGPENDGPSEDPSEPEPTGAAYGPEGDLGDDPDGDMDEQASITAAQPAPEPEPAKAPADWDGSKPATREQLQELTQCIAAAGFQPTDQGRTEWFAWLSTHEAVNRDISRNNQLSRREILAVIESMKADQ